MPRRRRELGVTTFSLLDVLCGALGVFVVMTLILLPYYKKEPPIPDEYAACVVNQSVLKMRFYDFRREDGDVIRVALNGQLQRSALPLTIKGEGMVLNVEPGVNALQITSVSDGSEGPNTGFVVIEPCLDGASSMLGWMIPKNYEKKFAIVRK